MFVFSALLAIDAGALLIPQAGIADTDGGLQVPMRRENPVVPVSETSSGQIAIVAFLLESPEVLRPMQVHTDKVPLGLLAEPIFQLRL